MKSERTCVVFMVLVLALLCCPFTLAVASEVPIDGLQLWLRADLGVLVSGNSSVLKWDDQSPNDNDAWALQGSEPVLVSEMLKGYPVIQFNGSNSFLVVPHNEGLNTGEGFSVFAVYRFRKGLRLVQKRSYVVGIGPDCWFLSPTTGLSVTGSYSEVDLFEPGEVFHLQSNVYDSAAGIITVYNDGEVVASLTDVSSQVPNDHDLYIGKRQHSTNELHLGGEIAELVIYNYAVSSEERMIVEEYLRRKYF